MKKDKITIFYVLLTLTILVTASIYIYNIDISKNNAQISEKAQRVYGSGKDYSKKVYSMFSAYTEDMGNYFDDDNNTINKVNTAVINKKALDRNKAIGVPIVRISSNKKQKEANNTSYKTSTIIIKTTKDNK